MVLQDIVTSESVLNDLKNLTQLLHTVTLEIYHALYNEGLRNLSIFLTLTW